MSHKLFLSAILFCLLGMVTSCSQSSGEEGLGSGGAGGGGGTSGGDEEIEVTDGTPLFFSLQTKYDDSGDDVPTLFHGTCQINPNNLAANDIPCTISVPEGVLRFSNTFITVGTENAALCPRVEFMPYYRQLSAGVFTPIGDSSTTDCNTSPTPAKCFDGAAVDIVPDFPKNIGVWFPTDELKNSRYEIKAAYNTGSLGNTKVCNNLATGLRGANQNYSGYPTLLANTFRDYVVTCRDPFQGVLFRITVTVQDYDFANLPNDAANNEFYDWN